MPDPYDATLESVAAFLSARAGLDFTGARGRWLRGYIEAAGKNDDTEWCERLLAGSPEAFASVCELATVQESYFFREPRTLNFLRREVLPELGDRPGPIRVWSAGCAEGQEVYSVAMILAEAGLAPRSHVLGTDLSLAAVVRARSGVFGSWSMRGVDDDTVARCFRLTDQGFAVLPRLHANVTFEQHNLLDEKPPLAGSFDLVLCRNVLIYLTPEAVERVAGLLASALRPGGWLLTGIADPPLRHVEGLRACPTARGTAYRRVESDATPDVTPPQTPAPSAAPRPRRSAAPAAKRRGATPARQATPSAMHPTLDEGWVEQAERALFLAQPHAAEQLACAALAAGRDRETAYALLVRALAADNRHQEALDAIESGVAEFPLAAGLRGLQSVVLLESGRAQEAKDTARQALYLDPNDALAHMTLARASDLLGDSAGARRARRNGQRLLGNGVR